MAPMPVRFAVIADSHFHPAEGPTDAAWPSDALFNPRNVAAVAMVREAKPAFVIHLGDVPHPVPGLTTHLGALAMARDTYADLGVPLYVVPGNHDVGDKPHPWAPAPSVTEEKHTTFRAWWGAPWWVIERDGVRLIGIDTPILNSGIGLEAEQWQWLESVFPAPDERSLPTFVFLHYPPFLLTPDEPEHYDNLAEPGRARLLDLFARARVQAVFCGHVHHPFWNRHRDVDFYLLPSMAFVRPGYSELGRVGPGDEFGRNDADRLGFCIVHVGEPGTASPGGQPGHRIEWVHTATPNPIQPGGPAPDCPLGLTLRHAWDAVLDIPADGLDPFRRKQARNDLALFASWELGAGVLRLPFEDLRRAGTRERLLALRHRGQRVVLYTAERLSPEDLDLVELHRESIVAVEFIVPRAWLDRPLPECAVPRWVAAFGRHATEEGRYFSHFAPHGFLPGDPDLARVTGDGILFRIDPETDPAYGVHAAREAGQKLGKAIAALVLLPRGGEGVEFTDDDAITARVTAALLAARRHPDVRVILDTMMDHDRGYFPRHGLIDRRGNPRPAFRELVRLAKGGADTDIPG